MEFFSNILNKTKEAIMGIIGIQVLIIDSNKSYQESIQNYLEDKFVNVTALPDWKSGLEHIKKSEPNIIIADANSDDSDILSILKRIKYTNPKIQVIVTSTHFEVDSILEAVHVGIADFIPKPIDFNLLEEALEKSVVNIEHMTPAGADEEKEENIYESLKALVSQNDLVEFTNYYKGVPISRKGNIVSVGDESLEIKLDNVQFQALLFEKFIVFEYKETGQIFIAKLYAANQKDKTAKLKDLKYMQYSPKRRVDVRVAPDDKFKLVVVKNNIPYRVEVHDVSIKSISFEFSIEKEKFNIDDKVVLNIAIYRKNDNFNRYKSVLKLDTTVYRIVPKGNMVNVIVIFDLTGDEKESISKYIYQRQLDIINEFKAMIKKTFSKK